MPSQWRQIINDTEGQTRIEIKTGSGGKGLSADCEPCLDCDLRDCTAVDELGEAGYLALINAINARAKNCRTATPLLDPEVCYTTAVLVAKVNTILNCAPWIQDMSLADWAARVASMQHSTYGQVSVGFFTISTIPRLTNLATGSTLAQLQAKLNEMVCQASLGTCTRTTRTALGNSGGGGFQPDFQEVLDEYDDSWAADNTTSVAAGIFTSTNDMNFFNRLSGGCSLSGGSLSQSNRALSGITPTPPNIVIGGTPYSWPNKSGEEFLTWQRILYTEYTWGQNFCPTGGPSASPCLSPCFVNASSCYIACLVTYGEEDETTSTSGSPSNDVNEQGRHANYEQGCFVCGPDPFIGSDGCGHVVSDVLNGVTMLKIRFTY